MINDNLNIVKTLREIAAAIESGGGGASSLSELSDTAITTPSNNDVLTYDATAEKWKNAAGAGGGFFKVGMTFDATTGTTTLNKTWQEIHDALEMGWYVSATVADNDNVGQTRVTQVSVDMDAQSSGRYLVGLEDQDAYLKTDSPDGYPVLAWDAGD